MRTKIVEVTNGVRNWGKLMLCRFDEEWKTESALGGSGSLLSALGWTPDHLWVLDLQTGEGALFRHGGVAKADMEKHAIWVCPMYEPFLEWLYAQDIRDLDKLPCAVDLKDAPFALYGHRRPGPERGAQSR
jgi:hypothetical protein